MYSICYTKEKGLTFSQTVTVVLQAVADGTVCLNVGVSQYPDSFATEMQQESKETLDMYQKGEVKGYSSGKSMLKEMFKDE